MKNTGDLHKGHRQRLKQRAQNAGLEKMEYHEVLEWLLTYTIPYKDVNPLAHVLIEHFGSLAGVLDAGYAQLAKFNGVGHETALFLSLLPELFDKYSASRNLDKTVLNNVSMCVHYFRSITHLKKTEEFYAFCLDAKQKLIKTVKVDGKASCVTFDLSAFTESISCAGATSVILMHTHPGNDASPTKADLVATKRLISVCYMLGVKVLDHIIVCDNEFYSFENNGLFEPLAKDVAQSLNTVTGISLENLLKASPNFKYD